MVADNQFQLASGGIFGAGSNHTYLDGTGQNALGSFFDIAVKTQDVSLYGAGGVVAANDFQDVRQVSLAVILKNAPDLPTLMSAGFLVLQTAWAPVTSDVTLSLRIDGTTYHQTGRPRGLVADWSRFRRGAIRALLRFDVTAPGAFV